jgi:hypothetical protein
MNHFDQIMVQLPPKNNVMNVYFADNASYPVRYHKTGISYLEEMRVRPRNGPHGHCKQRTGSRPPIPPRDGAGSLGFELATRRLTVAASGFPTECNCLLWY